MTLSLGILSLTKGLVMQRSDSVKTQNDFFLLRKCNLEMAKNTNVIRSEECVPQHKLMSCELRLKTPKPHPKPFSPKLHCWKMKEQTLQKKSEQVFKLKVNAFNTATVSTEEIWNLLNTALLDTSNKTCGKMKRRCHKRVIWWRNDEVNLAIDEKGRCEKAWKQGSTKEQYLQVKRNAKLTVYTAKKTAEVKKFLDLKLGMNDIFKISKPLRSDNQGVVGD